MYGMIHQAARQLVLQSHGEAAWRQIVHVSGLTDSDFISAQHYDDEKTLGLIGAISKVSGAPMDELLVAFGQHWITFAAGTSYGRVMDMLGDNLEEFIENLDRMHAGIKATMPQASMPRFELLASNDGDLHVLYQSERSGLTPFVVGLLRGLMARFGVVGDVTGQKETPEGVVFTISRRMNAAA